MVSSLHFTQSGCSSIIETWAAMTFQPSVGEAHPGLALAADQVAAAHLELEVHGGEVAAEREDLEADALLLDARARAGAPRDGRGSRRSRSRSRAARSGWCAGCPRRWRRARRRSCRSAPARSARTARAPRPRPRGCSASRRSSRWPPWPCATATSAASLPRAPTMDRPTGSPSTVAPGRLTCGTPVSPPCAAQAGDAIAQRLERRQRQALAAAPGTASSAGRGWCRAAADTPCGARASCAHQRGPAAARSRGSCEPATRPRATLNAMRGLSRSSQSLKVCQASYGLQRALRPRPDREALAAPCSSSRTSPTSAASALHHRLQRRGDVSASAKPKASTATIEPRRQRRRDRLAEQHRGDAGEGRGVAREPAGRVGARRLRQHAGEVEPAVGRADAVEAAEARRHAHRAAGVGAERGVAQPCGHRRGRARRGAAGHAVGRRGVQRRAVEGVLAEDAERDLVGDGLADQRGAGVEQASAPPRRGASGTGGRSASPGCRRRSGGRRRRTDPWRRRSGRRAGRRRALDAHARAGHEGADVVGHRMSEAIRPGGRGRPCRACAEDRATRPNFTPSSLSNQI